ncbi:hypothetical protein MRX96_047878 [Rhipicephalus microplus]
MAHRRRRYHFDPPSLRSAHQSGADAVSFFVDSVISVTQWIFSKEALLGVANVTYYESALRNWEEALFLNEKKED